MARGQYPQALGMRRPGLRERLAQHRQPLSNFQQVLDDGRILRISECRMPDGYTVIRDITDFIRATEAAEAACVPRASVPGQYEPMSAPP